MDPSPLRTGDPESLGPYRLLGRLGAGGQGVVFLARTSSGGSAGPLVAVKLLNVDVGGDTAGREEFVREVSAARRVARFCTAQMLEVGVHAEQPYIVSEYVEGPSLLHSVRTGGPRTGGSLERLAIGTATALAAIHTAGVVHRDLKPANVLLGPDGPRVIDFGIARALDSTSVVTAHVVGTPAYMAPEQIAGANVGPKADVFAWAGTMLFAANGVMPFAGDSIPATFHRILHDEPDLGRLTGSLREKVAAALAKDPADRPSAGELLLSLLSGADHEVSIPVPRAAGETVAAETVAAETVAAETVAAVPGGPAPETLLAEGATRAYTAAVDVPQVDAGAPTVEAGTARMPNHPPPAAAATARMPAGPVSAPVSQPVSDPVSGPARPGRRVPWWRTRIARWAAVAAVAVLLVGVALWVFVPRDSSDPENEPAVDAVPEAFAGKWTGSGHMPSEGVDYNLHITLTAGLTAGSLTTSETGCLDGTLSWLEGTASRIVLKFSPNTTECGTSTITFTSVDDDQLRYQVDPDDADDPYGGELRRE